MKNNFSKFSHRIAELTGSPQAFILAVLTVIVWAILGPRFNYSENWQLVINTGTTIITFLMVFLIQSAQNRDSKAVHLKLNELIKGVKGARNEMVNLEEASDEELEILHIEFHDLRNQIQKQLEKRKLNSN